MHPQSPPPAFSQHFKIATGLGCFHNSESVFLSGHRQIIRIIASDLQKNSFVGSALVSLSRRMQKAWSKPETGGGAFFVPHQMAGCLQCALVLLIHLDISEQGKVITWLQTIEM